MTRVINVLAFDRNAESNIPTAENHVVEDVWHFGTPTHPQTLRLLGQELGVIAARVPFVQMGVAREGPPVTAPPQPRKDGEPWGFLRPDEHARLEAELKKRLPR